MAPVSATLGRRVTHDESATLFGQTMGLVAATASFFAGLTMFGFQRFR